MAYIFHDIYDWYRDLMINKSGMYDDDYDIIHKFVIVIAEFVRKKINYGVGGSQNIISHHQ